MLFGIKPDSPAPNEPEPAYSEPVEPDPIDPEVGGGPDLLQLQALSQGIVLIPHVGVGFVPVIVAVEVVVEGEGPVALLPELAAQGTSTPLSPARRTRG